MNGEEKEESRDQSWLYRSHEDVFRVLSFCYRYETPQYGSRRRLLPPAGQEEYGEVVGEAEEECEEEEVTTLIFYVMLTFQGNGNPFQYSCLDNPMD